jgi:hypothetical protein
MDTYYGNRIGGDYMQITEIVNLVIDGKYDKGIKEIKNLPPRAIYEFIDELQKKGKDFVDDFLIHLSDDQYKEWKWLASSKRVQEYIMSIPEKDLTEQDFADLKSTDF